MKQPISSHNPNHNHRNLMSLAFVLVMALSLGGKAWGQTWPDGLYYLKSNSTTGDNTWYLWPSIVTNTDTGQRYLTTYPSTTAPSLSTTPAPDDLWCMWVVKNITVGTNNYIQFINPKFDKYVIIRNKAFGDRDVWLDDIPTDDATRSYFQLTTPNNPNNNYYRISPTKAYAGNETNYGSRSFNSAAGDKNGLGSGSSGTGTSDERAGLIQLYAGDPKWTIVTALMPAPTVSDVDPATNTFTITDANGLPEGYTIRYTTDGTIPTATTGTEYTEPVWVTANWTVRAVVVRYGIVLTEVATKSVIPALANPVISFDNTTSKASITCTTTDAAIYYNTGDGSQSDPTTSSTLYNSPFDVTSPTTVKAISSKGSLTSPVVTLAIPQVATPTIQNNGSNAISITCATVDATIYYTTDGSTPSTSSTEYTGPLTENVSGVTIKAIAVKEGMINSAVGSGSVTLQCATPIIVRVDMTFSISCNMPTDANIYYSLDGSNPTTSSTQYTETVSFTSGQLPMTVKALATHTNYTNSEIATFELLNGSGTASDPYLIYGDSDFASFISDVNAGTTSSACYKLMADVSASGANAITTTFTGSFDGGLHIISDLGNPLFQTVTDGVVCNVLLRNVEISQAGDVGAIVCDAKGYTRIYNCGILPTDAAFSDNNHSSVASSGSSGSAGSIVGKLEDDSRVVNCFSYSDVSSTGYAAGIVGNNTFASNTAVTDGKYANLRTMVVNCMFYGDITSGSSVWPVYGGTKITNAGANAINNYNFYSDSCSFSTPLGNTTYYCSWPAKYDYLTRYEYHRYLLNSNRELCGWWVGATSAPSTMTTAEVQAVPKDASIMAKWVLDRSVAPFPILKSPGYYPSPVNIDADASWRETANEWEGKKLGTLSVTINPGSHAASGVTSTTKDIVITDMDTLHGDYCYRKIQLPYYNSVFGDPDGSTWDEKYGGNYKNYVVTGWEITSTNGAAGNFTQHWETGYNFADRYCSNKDLYTESGRIFAQGGYYYVPYDVTTITITAHWGNAIYLANGDNYYDRVDFDQLYNGNNLISDNKPGTAFAPAGIRSALGNGETVYTDKIATVADNLPNSGTVYDNAIVLVGNHQYCTGGEDVAPSRSFTIMSADFDLDNEPDYCLEWQLGKQTTRQSICPIRFDFLPVEEIGLCLKKDGSTQYYSLGCYRPLGHFEVTETALIRFGQFEFSNVRTVECPIILNGGIFEQYTKGTTGGANASSDKITYVIIGGNVMMPSFTPGAHVNNSHSYSTRHCAVNAIGGKVDELYLTGNYNDAVTPYTDNPHCYIDGGYFKQVAAAGKEGINGNVFFKVNHAVVHEFYGGGTIADKIVTGSIDVTIANSRVHKYCGGPKFGDMENGKTVATNATGTTFGVFYGGGNGGTSYVQYGRTDGEQTVPYTFNLNDYTPGQYRNETTGYKANYDLTITNVSTGTNGGKAIYRSYFFAAQFSATNTGNITNELTDCTIRSNFYGGGNLGGVNGNVTSTLTDTDVHGSAFGAGYSASIPKVTIYNKDKTPPSIDVYTGIITPISGGTSTTYRWSKQGSTSSPITTNPNYDGVEELHYFYTEKSLENLGAVTGNATLTIKGNSIIGTSNDPDSGNVYGGGDQSAVTGNCEVILQGNTNVRGSVYGGGNRGLVGGTSSVTIQDP